MIGSICVATNGSTLCGSTLGGTVVFLRFVFGFFELFGFFKLFGFFEFFELLDAALGIGVGSGGVVAIFLMTTKHQQTNNTIKSIHIYTRASQKNCSSPTIVLF